MKSFKYFAGILTLALLLTVLFACDDTPIFYTLEKAYQTSDDRGLDDTAKVVKIVYTGAPANRYFVHAQSVFQRDSGTGNWQRVTPPASGALCGGLEYFSVTGDIIAWFYDSIDLEPVGLYSRDPSSAPGDSWTEITDDSWPTAGDWPDLQFRIHFIKEVNNQLFVSTSVYHADEADPDYEKTFSNLYYAGAITGTDDFYPCLGADLESTILDVEHDGTDYWLITTPEANTPPTYLYTGGTPTTFAEDPGRPDFSDVSSDPAALYAPHSLYVDSGNRLYLSGWQGRIYFRDAGVNPWSAWTGDPVTVEVSNTNYIVPFRGFVETGKNIEFFVGTHQYGYYSFTAPLIDPVSAADLTRQPAQPLYEYPPNELVTGAILGFLAPADAENADTLFACTAGTGLWRGDWDGSKWIWKQE